MRTNYANRTIAKTDFGDRRLVSRFEKLVEDLSTNITGTLPEAGKTKHVIDAQYRFFKNPQVIPAKMLSNHVNSYIESLEKHQRILHIMDTVEYDYTGKRSAKHLGPLNYIKRRGLYQHNSLLLTEKGVPLGLLEQSYIIRTDDHFGKADARRKLPFSEKESYRWYEHLVKAQNICKQHVDLEVVSIADREADIMELFQACTHNNKHFVIRSQHNRKLADGRNKLYPTLSTSNLKGTYEIQIAHPVTKKKRKAQVEVRFMPVELKLDRTALPSKRHLPAFKVNAIEIKEINPPKEVEEAIHWILLTTLPVENLQEALIVIKYYCLRWLIERFHYTLKSGGAKLEELQLTQPHRIKNAITAYSIAAMNVFKIRYWAEHQPDINIYELGISPTQHKVLYTYAHHHINSNIEFNEENPPSIKEFAIVLGQLGGFIPSKRQPIPGIKILSRAIVQLDLLVNAFLSFNQNNK